jgi:hypothetical protein
MDETPPIDANAALAELRAAIHGYDTAETIDEEQHQAELIRDRAAELDRHLTGGGRLPMNWRAAGDDAT